MGLAGGMNLYGFAGGDPVNFDDPFGLDPYVQCRPTDDASGYSHCAVRVVDQQRKLDVMIELVPVESDGKKVNEVWWNSAPGEPTNDAARAKYSESGWVRVGRPAGMSEDDFDDAVINSAAKQTESVRGKPYSFWGQRNSNHFVYEVVTGAGGKVPAGAAAGKKAPGICGGSWTANGSNCSK